MISTRRISRRTIHEMADLGTKTLCGRDLLEPWNWTDGNVNCKQCLAKLEALILAENEDEDEEAED